MNAGLGSPLTGPMKPMGTSQHQGQWGVQGGRPLGNPAARMMNHPNVPPMLPRMSGMQTPMLGQALMGGLPAREARPGPQPPLMPGGASPLVGGPGGPFGNKPSW